MPRAKKNSRIASDATGTLASGNGSDWHDCLQHAFEEAASGIESWEYGGAETAEEFKMTRKAAMLVARKIRAMAVRHDRAFHKSQNVGISDPAHKTP